MKIREIFGGYNRGFCMALFLYAILLLSDWKTALVIYIGPLLFYSIVLTFNKKFGWKELRDSEDARYNVLAPIVNFYSASTIFIGYIYESFKNKR